MQKKETKFKEKEDSREKRKGIGKTKNKSNYARELERRVQGFHQKQNGT